MACVAAPIIGGLDRYPSNDVPKPSIGHAWFDTLDALCSPCRRFDQVCRCDAAMWDGFKRFVIDGDVRVVAVDQGSELGNTLQVGGVAVATQEQLAASLHDAVALARPDRVHAPDVLDAKDDCDAVAAGCRHDLGQGMGGGMFATSSSASMHPVGRSSAATVRH